MVEKHLNTILKKNLNIPGVCWAHKIPDPPKAVVLMAAKNPFDIFGYHKDFDFVIESKLSKSWQAFAFSRIADHQIDSLRNIKEVNSNKVSVVILGVWIPRKNIELFVFDIKLILAVMKTDKKSFNKKELIKFKELGYSIEMVKKVFDPTEIKNKMIGLSEYARIKGSS